MRLFPAYAKFGLHIPGYAPFPNRKAEKTFRSDLCRGSRKRAVVVLVPATLT